jgi:hypothetical protein
MPITDHRITNLKSFQKVTEDPRDVAGLYFYQMLDCLVDLAYKVSCDFRKRPQLYRELGEPAPGPLLAEFNARYGTSVDLLSASQRNEIYMPVLGSGDASPSSGSDSFARLRNDLIRAATAFAEGASDKGVRMLREDVRRAHKSFKDYLVGLYGDSVRVSKAALSVLTEKTCYPILRSHEIAGIFGVKNMRDVEYPYSDDPSKDLLVEQISEQLSSRSATNQALAPLTREWVANLQRAAVIGAEAIATVIDFEAGASDTSDTTDLDILITKCYIWGATLTGLRGLPKVPAASPTPVQAPSTSAAAAASALAYRSPARR